MAMDLRDRRDIEPWFSRRYKSFRCQFESGHGVIAAVGPNEDLEIAEAQQNMKQWTNGAPDMALKADKAVNASHRILERLEKAEAQRTA